MSAPSHCPSPNHGERRGGAVPDMVLIHYTAMQSARAAVDWLCNPKAEVSAHYLIDRDGSLVWMVDEVRRAWHAGAGEWGGRGDVNSRSIGIELANSGSEPFPEPQMAALERLLDGLRTRWPGIAPERVLGHSDTAPGRKIDPGPRFDWRRLALAGHAVWSGTRGGAGGADALPPTAAAFLDLGQRAGYTGCATPEALQGALRLRFRPWAAGPLDAGDMALAADLADRYPVDRLGPTA